MGWRWSKQEAPADASLSAPSIDPQRYAGKPLLRLLEYYVLWSIGHLAEEDASRLQAMAPKLTDTFGGDGTWQGAIATTMELPHNMPELIRQVWARNQQIAAASGVELPTEQFAEMFVDSNLV